MNSHKNDPECIFCKIVNKQIPSTIVSEDETYTAIRDIDPQAPTHILVIPREHIKDVVEFSDPLALGKLIQSATATAKQENLDSFRLVINNGTAAGQSVFHLHIHLLGGRQMHWPPG